MYPVELDDPSSTTFVMWGPHYLTKKFSLSVIVIVYHHEQVNACPDGNEGF